MNKCILRYKDLNEDSTYLISTDNLSIHRIDSERLTSMAKENRIKAFFVLGGFFLLAFILIIYLSIDIGEFYPLFIVLTIIVSCLFAGFCKKMRKGYINEVLLNSNEETIETGKMKEILSYNESLIVNNIMLNIVVLLYALLQIRNCVLIRSYDWFIMFPLCIYGLALIDIGINPISIAKLYLKIRKNESIGI